MTASYEWTEYHLPPAGWVRGSEKTDFGREEVEPPVDRLLACVISTNRLGTAGDSAIKKCGVAMTPRRCKPCSTSMVPLHRICKSQEKRSFTPRGHQHMPT